MISASKQSFFRIKQIYRIIKYFMTKKRIFTLLLPILIFILLRLPSTYETYWYGDEGIYAAVSSQLSEGKNLYQQTWDHKPPLIFLLFSTVSVFGWPAGLIILKVLSITLSLLTILIINKIIREKVDDLPRFVSLFFLSFLLGSTLLEGNVVNAEVIFIFLNSLAFLLLIEKKYFSLVGFLAYLSLMTKIPGAVEFFLFFILFLIIYYRENGTSFLIQKLKQAALGFGIPLLLTLAYFYFQGTLTDFIYANLIFNIRYSLNVDNTFNFFGAGFPNTIIKFFSLLSILFFSFFLYFKKRISVFFFLVINFFNVQVFSSLLSGKNYGHYFIQVLPGGSMLIALTASQIKKFFKNKQVDVVQLKQVIVLIALFLPYSLVISQSGEIGYYAPLKRYYPSFFNGYILGKEEAKNQFWWRTGGEIKKTVNFAEYLDSHYLDYDQVYIYTDKPWLIALSQRKITNKYVVWFHLGYRRKHLLEGIENIRQSDLVVIDNDAGLLDLVETEIKTNYEKIGGYENFDVYRQSNNAG